MVGLHGVVAYTTSRRTTEIGLRMALGASRLSVARLLLADTVKLGGIGVCVGLGLALAATPLVGAFLVAEMPARDPLSFAGSGLAVVVICVAASWAPLRRALKTTPSIALRAD
jgi:ABC-type antimicrobial peptide transport system permease subunit